MAFVVSVHLAITLPCASHLRALRSSGKATRMAHCLWLPVQLAPGHAQTLSAQEYNAPVKPLHASGEHSWLF